MLLLLGNKRCTSQQTSKLVFLFPFVGKERTPTWDITKNNVFRWQGSCSGQSGACLSSRFYSLWTYGLPVISYWDLYSAPRVFVYFTTYLIKIQHITSRIGEKDERYTNWASGHFQYFHWISFALLDNFRLFYFLYFVWLNWNFFNCLAEWLPLFTPWFSNFIHFCTW